MAQFRPKNMEIALDESAQKLVGILSTRSPKASGRLANSFQVGDVNGTKGYSVIFDEYGQIVDGGRRPSQKMPPIKPILDWVRERGIKGSSKQSQESIAWAIAKTIQKKGYRPQPFIQPSLNQAAEMLAADIEQPTAKDIENYAQDILNETINGKTFELEL